MPLSFFSLFVFISSYSFKYRIYILQHMLWLACKLKASFCRLRQKGRSAVKVILRQIILHITVALVTFPTLIVISFSAKRKTYPSRTLLFKDRQWSFTLFNYERWLWKCKIIVIVVDGYSNHWHTTWAISRWLQINHIDCGLVFFSGQCGKLNFHMFSSNDVLSMV